jgi:ADP-dependent phosphofructokinase/glucokinase
MAIEEVTIWIDQHDSNDVPARINDHLAVISGDSDFIAEMISELGAGCKSPKVYDTRGLTPIAE